MNWSLGASAWTIALGLVLWLAAGAICYLNWSRAGRRPSNAWLELLRFVIVTLLGLTLLQPELVQTIKRTEKPLVAVLVDRSGSMATRDIQAETIQSRTDWVEGQLTEDFRRALERKARVEIEEFSPPVSAETNLSAAPLGTDLNAALEKTFQREQNLQAVLLLSDGDWNQGKSPAAAGIRYREQGIPIYSVAVGRETPLPDLALEVVNAPSYGLFGEQITIPFAIQSHLPEEVKTTVTLLDGSREETRKEITVPAFGQVQDALLWYPRSVGDVALTLQIPVHPSEALPDNNRQDFRIAVRVDKLRVLVIDSLPRWEYRYLRNALARDPGVEMNSLLFHPGLGPGGGRGYLDRFPDSKEALSKYDVVFLGDVGIGRGELTDGDADLLKGLVEQQASGLVFVPGRRGRILSLAQSALKDLIPVVFDEKRPEGIALQNEAVLTLTTQGKGHLLTRFDADESINAQTWLNLPGFFWSAAVEKSRPGSEVLAVHSSLRNASGRLPLLATRSAGAGKVLFLGTDSAWRWRRGVEDKYHYRFWSQVVRWMAHQRHLSEKEGIRLAYSPEAPQPRDTVFLQATVLNSAGFPAEGGPILATVTAPDGRSEQLQFTAVEGGWGVFHSSFTPTAAGKYKILLNAEAHGRKLETELSVQSRVIERIGQPVNRAILAELATLTGGASAMIDGFTNIVAQIAMAPEPKPLERRTRLWSSPWWGGSILALLTLYWIGRKLNGLL